MSPRQPAGPAFKLATALEQSEPLGRLLRRLHDAQAHFEAIAPLLPASLRADVRPGPVDGDCWTLLAAHSPAAAKVRQMLPDLLQQLQDRGRQVTSIKVRVQSRPALR